MSSYESERYQLHQDMAEYFGPDKAARLMSFLPPVSSSDVATKHDLAVIREQMVTKADLAIALAEQQRDIDRKLSDLRINERFDTVNQRFDVINERFDKLRDDIRIWNLATIVTVLIAIFGQRLLP